MKNNVFDKIIFSPDDVDLNYSPIRAQLKLDTIVLGAFNPGLTRLPNGNLLMMVRIAETLVNPIREEYYHAIRWSNNKGYQLDKIALNSLNTTDPRKYIINNYINKTYCLTSSSWLLPVELTKDGDKILTIHYDKIIQPEKEYQEYGVEDARITRIDNKYYLTACAVSSMRHSTILYTSEDGLNYNLSGVIFDHQNKDVVLFPQMINELFFALTRPMGDHYFASDLNTSIIAGPSINMARSPDLLHWKPVEDFTIQPKKHSPLSSKVGGGAPPIKTDFGWLVLFHGVEHKEEVGIYRTFACLLDLNNPCKILSINYEKPVLESDPRLTDDMKLTKYLSDVVFTSGAEEENDYYIIASGELDLCCRITKVPKNQIIQDLKII